MKMSNEEDNKNLEDRLKDKTVFITNTFTENSPGYLLACVIRNHAKLTVCGDSRYKMKQEEEGYRRIENGRVILINSEDPLDTEKRLGIKFDLSFYVK